MPSIRLERVTFAHHDAFPLLDGVSAVFPQGWTGLVGENGAGKTTLLRLVAGELRPRQGRIRTEPDGAEVVLCRQDVEVPGEDGRTLAARDDGPAWQLLGELALEAADLERWSSLSPGERRRWQVAAALAREPRVLLLDEPTNHLDAAGRALVLVALERFRGAGLLVSHDRALLEALTTCTARLHHGQLTLIPGHYGEAREIWDAEQVRASVVREAARSRERQARRALAEARSSRAAAERALSGRGRDPKDRDARSMGAQTLRSWTEARLGRDVRRLRTAAERAAGVVPDAPVAVELGRSVFLGHSLSPRPIVLPLDAPELGAGGRGLARDLHVVLRREDRIRLAGPNGAGKTTRRWMPAMERRSWTGCARSRPMPGGGPSRWSLLWGRIRIGSSPLRRRRPERSGSCCSPRGWPDVRGRWCSTSRRTTWIFRPWSASARPWLRTRVR